MKVNVTINLNIEAPDSTGMVGDARILLENIIYALHPFETQIAEHYDKWKTTEPIMGTVNITPTNESIGAFLLVPTKESVTFVVVKNLLLGWGIVLHMPFKTFIRITLLW